MNLRSVISELKKYTHTKLQRSKYIIGTIRRDLTHKPKLIQKNRRHKLTTRTPLQCGSDICVFHHEESQKLQAAYFWDPTMCHILTKLQCQKYSDITEGLKHRYVNKTGKPIWKGRNGLTIGFSLSTERKTMPVGDQTNMGWGRPFELHSNNAERRNFALLRW